jgi:hypothetical protein
MPKKLLKIFKGSLKEKIRSTKSQINMTKAQGKPDLQLAERLKIHVKSYAKLDRKGDQNVVTKDLESYFCGTDPQQVENRRLMKETLGLTAFNEVLGNDNIPPENKFSYLLCLKTSEWRMRVSDGSLSGRVQSIL